MGDVDPDVRPGLRARSRTSPAILDQFAPNYRPDDVYAGNLWGALECVNAGITTLVDWSHIMNTPAHADEAVRGLQESGIRSVFAFGFPNTSLQDWWFGPDYAGSHLKIDGDLARRLRTQYFNSNDSLVTMALATRGTNFCREDVVRYEWELAKELGLNITVHVAMYRFGYTKMQLRRLKELDLLYPNTTYIHSSHLADDEWQMVADSGSNVSYAPQIELQMGHGWAPGGQGARLRRADRAVVRRGHHGIVGPVHPDARDLRVRTGAPVRDRLGREPRVERAREQAHHGPRMSWPWRPSAVPRSPASPIGPAP